MGCATGRASQTWLHRLGLSFHIPIVSKATPPLPEIPTAGGSYVLSADRKRWEPETTETPELIEAPTDATDQK
jgi:hypothetical protein